MLDLSVLLVIPCVNSRYTIRVSIQSPSFLTLIRQTFNDGLYPNHITMCLHINPIFFHVYKDLLFQRLTMEKIFVSLARYHVLGIIQRASDF